MYRALPEDREDLPVDDGGRLVIDERFDVMTLYEDTMVAAAEDLAVGVRNARVGQDGVSWDSVADARVAADVIRLLDEMIPLVSYVDADDEALRRWARTASAIVNCGPLTQRYACIHELIDYTVPGPLGALLPEECLREDDPPPDHA